MEFLINIDLQRSRGHETLKNLSHRLNDQPILIESFNPHNFVSEKALFNLGVSPGSIDANNIDLIDFKAINGTHYMRVRNYQDQPIKMKI
jgi:hypothetical protein